MKIIRVMSLHFVEKNQVAVVIWAVVATHFLCYDEECVPLVILLVKGERKEIISYACSYPPPPRPPPPHECVLLCYRQNILMSFIVIGLSLLIIINSKEDFQEVLSGLYFIFYWQHPKLQVCLGLWTPQKNVRVRSPP